MGIEKQLILRTCSADRTSHGGFVWPESGFVTAIDWNPEPVCGYGLHGLLWGEGDGSLLNWSPDAKWIVAEVEGEIVELEGKIKFQSASVVFCGDRLGATEFIIANGARGAVVGGAATAGDRGTATAGYGGTATAGYGGTATAGYGGTATAGCGGTATAGYGGTATAGYGGTATAGYGGTATAGDGGTATAGDRGTATAGCGGTATAGYGGTATAGYGGTATAGYGGTATAGYGGTATAGDRGVMVFKFWDGKKNRYRFTLAYVGEKGIKPNTQYGLDDNNKVKEATL